MAYNRLVLKLISIAHLVMTSFFFTLGMLDGLEIGFIYSSLLFMPCWIAALVSKCKILSLEHRSMLNIKKENMKKPTSEFKMAKQEFRSKPHIKITIEIQLV